MCAVSKIIGLNSSLENNFNPLYGYKQASNAKGLKAVSTM